MAHHDSIGAASANHRSHERFVISRHARRSVEEQVIQSIEESEAVPPEELIRYKTDDGYFEMKMREMCEALQQAFNNPDYLIFTIGDAIKTLACQVREEMLKPYAETVEEWSKMTAEEKEAQMDKAIQHL